MSRFLDLTSLVRWSLNGVIFALSVYLVLMVGPWMETQLNPVITQFEIMSAIPATDDSTSIMTRFSKDRDCEFVGIAWYRGVQTRTFERVGVKLMNAVPSNPTRPIGYQRAGPWIVDLPVDELREHSFAEVTHRCHLLWSTRTHLFP